MDQMKRRSSLKDFPETIAKKLRSGNRIYLIENFSNEIFYEIFDYLDGYDIHQAFTNLNIRFQRLITSPSLLLKISLDGRSSSEIKQNWTEVIISNKEHIFSLHLRDAMFISEVFNSSFKRLQSIHLLEISPIQLLTMLTYFQCLPHLSSLRINLQSGYDNYLNDIYRAIFHLPSLKYNRLSVPTEEQLNILIPSPTNEQFSTLEYLVISHICDLHELTSILRHTPRLKRLICQNLIESTRDIGSDLSITLPSLIHVGIDDCRIKFDQFEKFMKKIFSQLQVLRIDDFRNVNFISPERWERFISQHMPHLITFQLKCYMYIPYHLGSMHFDIPKNQFPSQFWSEHGWNFRLDAKPDKIFYLISPEMSLPRCTFNPILVDDFTPGFINTHNTSISPVQLSITNYSAAVWRSSFIDTLRPIFLSIQFTSLHLFWSGMSLDTFIKLLNFLPNLDSLKLSSSLLLPTQITSSKDANEFRTNNNITKVCHWMDDNQMAFFTLFCSRLEYFEVCGVTDTKLKALVHYILMKTRTHIPHLHLLRLYIYNANDTMVEILKNMIDAKKLLTDYRIKRLDNVITLQWNLE